MFNPFKKSKPPRTPVKKTEGVAVPQAERPAAPASRPPVVTPSNRLKGAPAPSGERRMIGVLRGPHQTEKATAAQGYGWYTFRVGPNGTKGSVRRAVEERYGVSVRRVRMLRARSKAVRLGRIRGETPGFKKAMVKVAAGQSVEFT
ncbi:MAG: 50S ribosomal protein L23 [bacterium]|nr:50S ribosomal protein L23 [bacterium]